MTVPRTVIRHTTERLRIDIDSGKTGDKIPVIDPVAAPLGTDEEAAGAPIDPRIVEATRQEELQRVEQLDNPKSTNLPKPYN